MIEYQEDKRSVAPIVIAGVAALIVTVLIFAGYTLLRKRHADNTTAQIAAKAPVLPKAPKATIFVDEATLQGGNTTIGGTVKNTSSEKLSQLSLEVELKRRKDAQTEIKVVALNPSALDPDQEGHYSMQLRAQDYSSAKVVALKVGTDPLPFTTAQGQKRPLERLEPKTIIVGTRPPGKNDGFLNSPDKPAHVP
jgi:hypothetical protein